ncbi:hypothetical protein AB0B09_42080, partial [Streptomyces sp. NPDC044948]
MPLASAASDLSDLRDYALDWALVDVETSGLVPRRDRVLSVAVVTLDPDGRQTGEFSTLLDPGCPKIVEAQVSTPQTGALTDPKVAPPQSPPPGCST